MQTHPLQKDDGLVTTRMLNLVVMVMMMMVVEIEIEIEIEFGTGEIPTTRSGLVDKRLPKQGADLVCPPTLEPVWLWRLRFGNINPRAFFVGFLKSNHQGKETKCKGGGRGEREKGRDEVYSISIMSATESDSVGLGAIGTMSNIISQ